MTMKAQEGVSNSTVLSNNAVALSDYDAAVRAIEQTFEEAIRTSTGATEPTEESTTARMLLQDAQASLLNNLKRIVVPTSDEVFGDYVDLFHIVDDDEESLEACDTENSMEEAPEIPPFQPEEIDATDLLDTKALQEARELREVVRSLSERIQETRERVLAKVVPSSQSNDELVEEASRLPVIVSNEDNLASDLASTESFASSMEALSKLLRDSEWSKIPGQLESLQSTMEVIEKETDKDRPMSQTEVAIISRTNSTAMDDEQDEDDGTSLLSRMMALSQPDSVLDQEPLSATDRLAQFFEYLE